MISGADFTYHASPSSNGARCHWLPFQHALIPALQLLIALDSSTAFHISLSSACVGCHCSSLLAPSDQNAKVLITSESQHRLPHLVQQRQSPRPLTTFHSRAVPQRCG
ncbi:unnamed protein product [Prorocentrum cordatum]|uniref:Uncharacterized protein n=1 Tax=Prorocentrum cordatum TaxID=2364126 RepID=A0ABN9VUD1_9DINO|nr:unnamed protein product [Polarella glacialis]